MLSAMEKNKVRRVESRGRGELFCRVVGEGFAEKVRFEKDLKG